jgi:hypothetical protein
MADETIPLSSVKKKKYSRKEKGEEESRAHLLRTL